MFSFKQPTLLIFSAFLMLSLNACSLKAIKDQSTKIDKYATLSGSVQVSYQTNSPVVVAVLTYNETNVDIISQTQIDGNGNYQFNLLPGEYLIGTYIEALKVFVEVWRFLWIEDWLNHRWAINKVLYSQGFEYVLWMGMQD